MEREFAMLMLVCALVNLVGGDYGARRPSYIIQPAGPSKQHGWVGYGYSDYLPLSIPKPYFIPKWVPNMDPTYTAFWVPETPAPAVRHKAAAPAGPPVKGFGPPKGNSVVAAPHGSYPRESVQSIPLTAVRAPLPPQKPLFDTPIPRAPLPIGTLPLGTTTQDPLVTFAPAPLGQPAQLRASPPAAAAAAVNLQELASDPSFVDPKGDDVISNSVVPVASGPA